MSLVLSLFPGMDVLGMGFELEGYCVVEGPDVILGRDIRQWDARPLRGHIDGIIGGDPCQSHSVLANLVRAKGLTPTFPDMTEDYARIVEEVQPGWFVRLGRNYGIGASLISQRPQSVNKEVLSQVECLCVFQVNGAHERKAIREWVVAQGIDVSEMVDQLPGLKRGTCFVWSPQWLEVLEKHQILKKKTFDASATPDFKSKGRVEVRQLKPGEVDELRGAMAEVVERAEANDPKKLKATIARLRRELEKQPEASVDPEALERAHADGFADGSREAQAALLAQIQDRDQEIDAANEKGHALIRSLIRSPIDVELPAAPRRNISAHNSRAKTEESRRVPGPAPAFRHSDEVGGLQLPAGARRILAAVVQHGAHGLKPSQVAMMAGIARKKSTWRSAMAPLRQQELIDERDGRMFPTHAGIDAVGNAPAAADTLEEKLALWMPKLGKASRDVLSVLVEEMGEVVSREDLGDAAGIDPTKSTMRSALAPLRAAGLVEDVDGGLRVAEALVG